MNDRSATPLTVAAGVLEQREFDDLSPEQQADVERQTHDLARRYGADFFTAHRERHRADLRIVGLL